MVLGRSACCRSTNNWRLNKERSISSIRAIVGGRNVDGGEEPSCSPLPNDGLDVEEDDATLLLLLSPNPKELETPAKPWPVPLE